MGADDRRSPATRLRRWLARRRWRSARGAVNRGVLWAALGVAFAAILVLGTIAFTQYYRSGHKLGAYPLDTRIYKSLQLFVLESGSPDGGGQVPWLLEVTRFAAPLVAAYAIVQTLAAVFRDQVESLRLQFARGHIVVAGLGRTGSRLTDSLLSRGRQVVVIEADAAKADLDTVRDVGGLVVVGDARNPDTQRRARVGQASHLVALCGDDSVNTEVVVQAGEQAAGRRRGSLQCVAHLLDPDLCLLLCAGELERYGQAPLRADFINVYVIAAQALVHAYPPPVLPDGASPRVMIVGGGPAAAHLLRALARFQATSGPSAVSALRVTVVALGGQAPLELPELQPEVSRFTEITAAGSMAAGIAGEPPALTYICPDDDAAATAAALELRGLLVGHRARVVVVLERSQGLVPLFQGVPQPEGGPAMSAFGLLDEACQPEVMLTGMTEVLARELHRSYVDSRAGEDPAEDPALRPWRELPESLRESNRDQAAHVAVKLAGIKHTVVPLTDWDTAQHPFSAEEVEIMARLEHERWIAERRRAGWRPGPRDVTHRRTPYLVPWEQLPDDIRDYDRVFVRQLPRLLAAAGLQAVRWDDGAARQTLPMPQARGSPRGARD